MNNYSSVSSPVRLDLKRFVNLLSEGQSYDINRSLFVVGLMELPAKGTFFLRGEDGRLDWIAHKVYGSTQYWWILLFYNGMVDPEEVVSGMSIRFPSVESLEKLIVAVQRTVRPSEKTIIPALRIPLEFKKTGGNLTWRLLNYSETSVQVERLEGKAWATLNVYAAGVESHPISQATGIARRYRVRIRNETSSVVTGEVEVVL